MKSFLAKFPLHTFPPIPCPSLHVLDRPVLWIHPPRNQLTGVLSSDLDCLKWQAYIALRGLSDIAVRWDVSQDGALEERLPNLQVPPPPGFPGKGELMAAHGIPAWVDTRVGVNNDLFEGYNDQAVLDESRAWVSLLEGHVHAALVFAQAKSFSLTSLVYSESCPARPIETLMCPPPPPLSGVTSLLPPQGTRIPTGVIDFQYREAIAAISERLGDDEWFLNSKNPTPIDALLFAYLHCLLHASDTTRIEVARRANLVAWEKRLQGKVVAAFRPSQKI